MDRGVKGDDSQLLNSSKHVSLGQQLGRATLSKGKLAEVFTHTTPQFIEEYLVLYTSLALVPGPLVKEEPPAFLCHLGADCRADFLVHLCMVSAPTALVLLLLYRLRMAGFLVDF